MHTRSSFGPWFVINIGLAVLISHGASSVWAQADNAELAKLRKTVETQTKQIEVLQEKLALQQQHVADLKDFVKLMKEYVDLKERNLKEGRKDLEEVIKERETTIAKLEGDFKAMRTKLVEMELDQKSRKIREDLAGKAPGPSEGPNPPEVFVNGKIEKIDGDLVLIDLGIDHGVTKGKTLDVYRIAPVAKYLGMIRIIDANHNHAVGRRMVPETSSHVPKLLQGDLVTSDVREIERGLKNAKELPAPPGLKGSVQKIDPADSTLVTISLGSDAGLAIGQTLEVYGFRPDAVHLGAIRILAVTPGSATARRLGKAPLQVDDEVVSKRP